MMRTWLVLCVVGLVVSSFGCTRPITVESVQRDVPSTGTKLLNATREVQNATYALVKAKALSPQEGIAILDKTEQIGVLGVKTADELDRLDLLVQAGKADGQLITQVLNGLAEMAKLYPEMLSATLPPQVATAVKEAQALIATLQDTYSKLRGGQ